METLKLSYWTQQLTINTLPMNLQNRYTLNIGLAALICLAAFSIEWAYGQNAAIRYGRGVPLTVRAINNRSLSYLANTQMDDGGWPGGEIGLGITGICVMAFMASGEDPDFGPYATHLRKALCNIIANQDAETGYLSGLGHGPMYHHGFAMLALSEAYGAVNEQQLWQGSQYPTRTEAHHRSGFGIGGSVRVDRTAEESVGCLAILTKLYGR